MFPYVEPFLNNCKLFLSFFRILRMEMFHVCQRVESIHKTDNISYININIYVYIYIYMYTKTRFLNEKNNIYKRMPKYTYKMYTIKTFSPRSC